MRLLSQYLYCALIQWRYLMTKLVTLSAAIEKQLYITLKKSRNFVEKTSVTLQKLIIKDEMDLMNYKSPYRGLWKNH